MIGLILAYHRIAALAPDTHGLCVSPDRFSAHLRYLADECRPVTLDELRRARDGRRTGPRPLVAVTFDDGYVDALTTASPRLVDAEVPATFFICGDHPLGAPGEFWWDVLERVLRVPDPGLPTTLTCPAAGVEGVPVATEDERRRAHETLRSAMFSAEPVTRARMVEELSAWSGLDLAPRETHRRLSTAEVGELARRPGHALGCHTGNHPCLPAMREELRAAEIYCNRLYLQDLAGRPIDTFAYPYGSHDDATVRTAREMGMQVAVGRQAGVVGPDTDQMRWPRLEVKDWDAEELAQRMLLVLGGFAD
jgi:peptidoglycan/xylan/chitin deacetylase (PgdA/CDA1 family)